MADVALRAATPFFLNASAGLLVIIRGVVRLAFAAALEPFTGRTLLRPRSAHFCAVSNRTKENLYLNDRPFKIL